MHRNGSKGEESSSLQRGSSLVELVVALAVILVGLLAFSRALVGALDVGDENRDVALATAAAQGMVEELFAADPARVFALYNDDPDDDPDGIGTAPGARFVADGLTARAVDAGKHGRILFPVDPGSPAALREDVVDAKLHTPLDMNLDGMVDDFDHSADYRVLPVLVRIDWMDGNDERELEVTTILGAR